MAPRDCRYSGAKTAGVDRCAEPHQLARAFPQCSERHNHPPRSRLRRLELLLHSRRALRPGAPLSGLPAAQSSAVCLDLESSMILRFIAFTLLAAALHAQV